RLAVVTPSHHSPLGMALSLPRRLDLLAWAAEAGAWILEDDYDGEFHFRGRPLPALKSLDEAGRVLYAGTFSKVLLPSLRLGYLVVPRPEVARFAAVAACLVPTAGQLEQAVVAAFMAEGHFARHLRRMRAAYRERRAALERAIAEVFGERLRLDPRGDGMNLVAWLPPGVDDIEAARRAQAHGMAPSPLSPWHIEARRRHALILGFANIAPEAARHEARRLERALAGA
ncbi:MAG: PLP-dependent aminotransferase family protein, partial [Rhodospirillaceae bacterium]|nr:PLP-dependent aminotransferase family protein [Rhodospirillaceae bacterium]